MKLLLKLSLALLVTLAGLYLASPLWLPSIIASRLPAGWQLEKIEMSLPGWSGVSLQRIHIKGELPGVNLDISADDSRLSYKGLATHVGVIVIDVQPTKSNSPSEPPFTVEDLSLPVLRLRGGIPELTVDDMKLVLHLAQGPQTGSSNPGSNDAEQPIELALQGFKLGPDEHGGYQVRTAARMIGQPQVNGYLALEVAADRLSADMRFPADKNLPAWLELSISQQAGTTEPGSKIQAVFDSDLAGQQWLDAVLNKSTAGRLTHLSGRLEAQAAFSGPDDSHGIQNMTLAARQLWLDLDGNSLLVNADVQADRQQDVIKLTLPAEATIGFQDEGGKVSEALAQALPELSRSGNPAGRLTLSFAENSHLDIESPDGILSAPAFQYGGDFGINYLADTSSIDLAASDVSLAISDTAQLQDFDLKGDIRLNLKEQQALSYTADSINFRSEGLALATSGRLKMSAGQLKFDTDSPMVAKIPKLQLKIQTGTAAVPAWVELKADEFSTENGQLGLGLAQSDAALEYVFEGPLKASKAVISIFSSTSPPATIISAAGMELNGTLDTRNGQLASSGSGHLSTMHIEPMAASANRADLKWNELDMALLTGNVSAKTQGFKVKIEEQTWSGFDFDLNMNLLADEAVTGAGNFVFTGGPKLPVNFSGNTGTGWWDITIDKSSMPLNGLRSVLSSAHFTLPAGIKLIEGNIEVAGQIEVHEEISAKFELAGANIAGAMAESNAQKASFKFESGYLGDVFVSGPLDIENMMLAGGIGVSNIHMDLDVQNSQTINLSNLSADVFDGQLELKALSFADGRIEDTNILISRINLQKLLAYLDVNGLEGTGSIDFVLPAGSEKGSVHIKDGTFTSTGPGKLAYSAGGAASTNIGLHALNNFHYKKLSGTLAYDSKGPYQIGIRLEGSNPDLYNGYPLIFNLNINGSLPEVFEAMFMTGSFEEAILKQVKIK